MRGGRRHVSPARVALRWCGRWMSASSQAGTRGENSRGGASRRPPGPAEEVLEVEEMQSQDNGGALAIEPAGADGAITAATGGRWAPRLCWSGPSSGGRGSNYFPSRADSPFRPSSRVATRGHGSSLLQRASRVPRPPLPNKPSETKHPGEWATAQPMARHGLGCSFAKRSACSAQSPFLLRPAEAPIP